MTTLPRTKIHQAYTRWIASTEAARKEWTGTGMSLSDHTYDTKRIDEQLNTGLAELGKLPLDKIPCSAYRAGAHSAVGCMKTTHEISKREALLSV